ncbi:2209_t:CDS:2 [Dentiscutata erythropus]|uniref:2209_t:CDS:1 n=1 Tax=Dentiscutata erythropus TaxID=1348616 RepID=A0A9N9EV12_9GLOM|nr:2209_t:CDS:2 [Dentiscutata erythropus]
MGDIPLACPQDYTYETSEIRLACNIRLTNLLCMLVFPILCVLYGISVWILITCSRRTGQKCEFKSVQFLKLIIFDEEEEFIKAELDNFKSNSNLD